MIINKENIEEHLLLLIDGELSAAEEAAVMAFVESHEEYQLLLDAYLDTKLEDEPMLFEGKESLLKEEVKVLPLKRNKLYMAWAAGLVAVIGIGFVFKMMTDNTPATPTTIAVNNPASLHADTSTKQSLVVEEAKEPVNKTPDQNHLPKAKKTNTVAVVASNTVAVKRAVDDLNPLPVAAYSAVKVVATPALVASVVVLPTQMEAPVNDNEPDNKLFANSEKLELVNALVNQLETMKDNVQEKTKSLRIASFAIRFGNKEYTIGKSFR